MPLRVNCASTWENQRTGSLDQNGGILIETAETGAVEETATEGSCSEDIAFAVLCLTVGTNVVIPYLRLNTAANKLDSNEQLLFLSLQNQKDFNMHNAISSTSVVYDVTNS